MKSEFEQMVMNEASLKSRRRFLLGAAGGAALGGFGFGLSGIAAAANLGVKSTTPTFLPCATCEAIVPPQLNSASSGCATITNISNLFIFKDLIQIICKYFRVGIVKKSRKLKLAS